MSTRQITPSLYGVYCAIVSLPSNLCERDRPLQERHVFFEAPSIDPCAHLEKLLSLTWGIDARGWCEMGWAYNISSAQQRYDEGSGEGDSRIFECGWGGADGTLYIERADADFFVTPRVRARLDAALTQAEAIVADRFKGARNRRRLA